MVREYKLNKKPSFLNQINPRPNSFDPGLNWIRNEDLVWLINVYFYVHPKARTLNVRFSLGCRYKLEDSIVCVSVCESVLCVFIGHKPHIVKMSRLCFKCENSY